MVFALNKYIYYISSKNKNITSTYKYPKMIIYMLYACFTLPLLLSLAPDSLSLGARGQFKFIEISSSLIIIFLIVYCSRYAITMSAKNIEYGAFFKSEISYESIRSVKYQWVNNGQFIKLTLDNGKSKTFEKGVDDFDGLAKALYRMLDKRRVVFSAVGKANFF
jgi:hypothetical protein